jgi:hypothetical protein
VHTGGSSGMAKLEEMVLALLYSFFVRLKSFW